jgi:diacylglycerol kinase family enzyme
LATEAPHVLIVNPSAGGGRGGQLRERVERELDHRHLVFRTVVATSLDHGVEQALAASEASEIPVVLSGDGLIGRAGGALARSETPLGIIPAGRGNDLARVLGIPTDPASAVAVLAAGERRRIDVGEANGRRFLGIASTGFDSECNGLANRTRWIRGNLVYAYAALRTLIGWRPTRFRGWRAGWSAARSWSAPPTARRPRRA